MKNVLPILLGWLLFALAVQAASFDCRNAGTRVEHIICNNPDISRLDEEMAAAYQAALGGSQDAEALKRKQKEINGVRLD